MKEGREGGGKKEKKCEYVNWLAHITEQNSNERGLDPT